MRERLSLLCLFFVFIDFGHAAPTGSQKMAFTLAEPDDVVKTEKPKGLMGVLQEISENSYVKDFMSLLDVVGAASAQSTPRPTLPVARGVRTQWNGRRAIPVAQQQATNRFQQSMSMDDAPKRIQADVAPSPPESSISKEEWAKTLFGERGVLTGIFQMMDQQRKSNVQSDSTTLKGKKLDLKEVFDSLLMAKKGELGDSTSDLPEFLGICNRLSCGDIYKAIDKFRSSDFFSNFQTALSLIQDPNGWETIGKLLSNPELISQFTGANSGMGELFGSALGEVKKESNKTNVKNSKLLPEDGDFGVDFSEDGEDQKEKKMPEIDFNVDKPARPDASDYYDEVSKGTGISTDEDEDMAEKTIDVAPPPPPPPPPPRVPPPMMAKKQNPMPDLSFSIDEATEEEGGETVSVVDATLPPKKTGMAGQRPFVVTTTTTRGRPTPSFSRFTTPTITTSRTITPRATTRWTPPPPTTPKPTTKNYRKDSDYYSMYYDDPHQG